VSPFELLRAEVAERRVQPIWNAVDLDVLEHARTRLLTCSKAFPVDRLDLEAVVPALRRRVIAVAPAAHAGDESLFVGQVAMLVRTTREFQTECSSTLDAVAFESAQQRSQSGRLRMCNSNTRLWNIACR
jgi:hypothetical protein